MELDYREVLGKMREIAKAEGLDVMSIGDQDALLARAIKDLQPAEETEEEGEKHYGEEHGSSHGPMVEIAPKPFGGATSFSDHDEFEDAIDTELHVKELGSIFRLLVNNIFDDEEMTLPQKADAVVSAATELSTRVKAPPPTGGRSLIEKMNRHQSHYSKGACDGQVKNELFPAYPSSPP